MNSEPLVSIRALNIHSDDKTILYDVDLDLLGGEITGLMGPMGCGKSTLLKFLAQEIEENNLTAKFSMARYNGADIVGAQNLPSIIRQNIREHAETNKESAILLFKRKNAILQGISNKPELICIDEPTAGLNENDGNNMMSFLRGLSRKHAVLVVSHNMDQVRKNCDRVVLMASGRVVSASKTDAFFSGDDGDTDVKHFIQSGSLDIPRSDTPAANLSPEYRVAPIGFNLESAEDSVGGVSVIDGKLALKDFRVDENGKLELARFSKLNENQHLYHFETLALCIYDCHRELVERIEWSSKDRQPDHNKTLTLDIGKKISDHIDAGGSVVINTGFNQNACAPVLAGFYLMKGFSPVDALSAAGNKLPQLHFGMRLEQLVWDMDLDISMARKN